MSIKLLLTSLCTLGLISCLQHKSCTEIGCSDSAFIRVQTEDNHWEDGAYVLTFTVNDESTVCSLRIPDDLPENGSLHSLNCDSPAGAGSPTFSQAYTCQETRTDDAVSESCTPIPDEYVLEFSLSGTPDSVDVRLEKDEELLVERTVSLTYEDTRPNGPDCEPLCRLASAVVEVP